MKRCLQFTIRGKWKYNQKTFYSFAIEDLKITLFAFFFREKKKMTKNLKATYDKELE